MKVTRGCWLALLGWLLVSARPVHAADEWFAGVTWGMMTPGFMYVPPRTVRAQVNQTSQLALTYRQAGGAKLAATSIEVIPAEPAAVGQPEVYSMNGEAISIRPAAVGEKHYRILYWRGATDDSSRQQLGQFELTVVALAKLPLADLTVNVAGAMVLATTPVQLLLVDVEGNQYSAPLTLRDAAAQPWVRNVLGEPLQAFTAGVYTVTSGGVEVGRFTVVAKQGPYTQVAGAPLTVPRLLLPPVQPGENQQVQWQVQAGDGLSWQTLAVTTTATAYTLNTTRFAPGTYALRLVVTVSRPEGSKMLPPFLVSFTVQAAPLAPLSLPLAPLFGGTVSLAQLAQQDVALPAQWPSLTIAQAGPWRLAISLATTMPLAVRLALGPAFQGQSVTQMTPAVIDGLNPEVLALTAAQLILPRSTMLAAGTYVIQLRFEVTAAPNPIS